jgi:hypothetical protein
MFETVSSVAQVGATREACAKTFGGAIILKYSIQ